MPHRAMRSDTSDGVASRARSTPSVASDIQSTSGGSISAAPPIANPQPTYIGTSGAAQLVSTETGTGVSVSEPALVLLNSFLDQILYNILTTAQSTGLPQLKTAVPIVLKPRLGKAALSAAEDELREYLEDSDEDEVQEGGEAWESRSAFDVDLAWKLARLRCMVYTRLGDLEEEDEEEYIEQEQLNPEHSASRDVYVGPASAIFLTSVLEFLGEQALFYAAQRAQKRSQLNRSRDPSQRENAQGAVDHDNLMLEEVDMFQVGRESPLSRLWRSWRRDNRLHGETFSRSISPENSTIPNETTALNSPRNRFGGPAGIIDEEPRTQSVGSVLGTSSPTQFPLPIPDPDVNEREVRGLAREPSDDNKGDSSVPIPVRSTRRPSSMLVTSSDFPLPLALSQPRRVPELLPRSPKRPKAQHTRSSSLPPPAQTPFVTSGRALGPEESTSGPSEGLATAAAGSAVEIGGHEVSRGERSERLERSAEEHAQLGKVAAAVSAVAGALGFGAIATSLDEGDERPMRTDVEATTKPGNKAAEPILPPSLGVSQSTDAVLGASITSTSDFSGIQIPAEQQPEGMAMAKSGRDEASDPEDLALSSGDEASSTARGHHLPSSDRERRISERRTVAQSGPNESSFYHEEDDDDAEDTMSRGQFRPLYMTPPEREALMRSEQASQGRDRDATEGSTDMSGQGSPRGLISDQAYATDEHIPCAHETNSQPVPEDKSTTRSMNVDDSGASGHSLTNQANAEGPSTAGRTAVPATIASASEVKSHPHATSSPSQHSTDYSSSGQVLGSSSDQQSRPQQKTADLAGVAKAVSEVQSHGTSAAKETSKPSKKKHLRLTTDSDEERGVPDVTDDAKKKDLEVLINSDETLHYTLTPVSARGEQFPIPTSRTTQTQDLADFLRNTKPPVEESPRSITARSATQSGVNPLRSNPPQPDSASPKMVTQKIIPSSRNITPIASSPSKSKSAYGGPRDPRIDQGTTRDLADYVRSTGPESAEQLPKALPQSTAASAASIAFSRSTGPRSQIPPGSSSSASTTTPTKQRANRPKFQAREAAPSRRAETSELIDFIREGPPRATGDHRIDRNVAPFRRTMDSDDINGLAPQHNGDQNGTSSVASTQDSSLAPKSINSRTGLLETNNRPTSKTPDAYKALAKGTLRQTALAEEDPMPKRTRRNIRDPYAIPDSDDDSVEEVATPKPQKQDESLIDFLRNTAPPPVMAPQPVMATASSGPASDAVVKRESSTSGLKDRLLRNGSLSGGNRKGSIKDQGDQPRRYIKSTTVARDESPHESQAGTKVDNYKPTKPTHAAHIDKVRQQRQRTSAEPRDPRTAGNTADLADYLKNSGPAGTYVPSATGKRIQAEPIKEEAGFLKFFSRRRSFRK